MRLLNIFLRLDGDTRNTMVVAVYSVFMYVFSLKLVFLTPVICLILLNELSVITFLLQHIIHIVINET